MARLSLGISEAEAAEAHGVTLRTYRRYERGGRSRWSGVKGFAAKYDVSADWLLLGTTAGIRPHLARHAPGTIAILPAKHVVRE